MRYALAALLISAAVPAAAETLLPGVSRSLLGAASTAEHNIARADPRAVDVCNALSETFVQVASCLPAVHVGVVSLDAFDEIYPETAAPLKRRCIELNTGNPAGALACVTSAIEAAIYLGQALPEGSTITDPVFHAVADSALYERLKAAITTARAQFPKTRLWGGASYYEYK